MSNHSDTLLAMMAVSPFLISTVNIAVKLYIVAKKQRGLFAYLKQFKRDLLLPIDTRGTKRHKHSKWIFALYLYGTCKSQDDQLNELRIDNLVGELNLNTSFCIHFLLFAAYCLVFLFLAVFHPSSSLMTKIHACLFALALSFALCVFSSRVLRRRRFFYKKRLIGYSLGKPGKSDLPHDE